VLTAVLVVADLLLGEASISGTFALGPFLASALTTPRWTVVLGAFATSSAIALSLYDDVPWGPALLRIMIVACGCVLSVWMAARRRTRERQLVEVTRVADVAQRAILAPVPALSGAFAFASAYVSASREAAIGGDLLDVVPTESGSIRIVVGDVRGKGLGAVRLSAMMLASFRELALVLPTLGELPPLLDRRLAPHLGEEDFVTAVIAELGPGGAMMLFNCAHPAPLLLRNGQISLLETGEPTTPFGLDPEPQPLLVQLQSADRVLFYTDGLVEARPPDSSEFVSLESLAGPVGEAPFDGAVEDVLRRLRADVGGQLHDDLALLLTEFRPDSRPVAAPPLNRSLSVERLP
jgi:serine phosphatase RsbU (regulator of sigma subunit)